MTLHVIDVVFIVIISGFSLFGLWFGLVHTLGSLLGTIFGAYVASRYYEPVAQWLIGITGWDDNSSRVLVFIVLFFTLNRLFGLAFAIADRFLGIVTKMPFVNSMNKFLGMLFGFIEGLLSIGLIIYFVERFPLTDKIMERLADSTIAPYASKIASVFLPLLPQALKILKSTVDYVADLFLK
jgi:uncharacterized membrane protein required for colicin V production